MPDLLIRDVMRIGVPTCKMEDTLQQVAALMVDRVASPLLDAGSPGLYNLGMTGTEYQNESATETLEVAR